MNNTTRKFVLITDLDNTLFDWVDLWHSCFTAMISKVTEKTNVPLDELRPQIREVHQRHGTSEYSFLLDELPALQGFMKGRRATEVFPEAIEAFRAMRREKLLLFPSVAETLLKIKGAGAAVVGYTESMAFYSNYRVRRLGLDGVFDHIFSPSDHDVPASIPLEEIRKYPSSHYEFRYTTHQHTPKGALKPNVEVLLDIVAKLGVTASDCIYVGDSLQKDIAMARDAGVMDAYALYGRAQHTDAYALLREVTHWSDQDVEREKKISEREIQPGITLKKQFSELLDHVEFGDWNGR